MLGRYFYFESNGSNKNNGNHLVEVQIVDVNGVNRAFGRGALRCSEYKNFGSPPSAITDGNTSTDLYFGFGEGRQHVVVDLGDVYDIAYIKVWRYYSDGRIYNDVLIQVSKDDVTYETVFSSSLNGTYSETSAGYQIDLPPANTGKYLICSDSTYYVVEGEELVALEMTELTAENFEIYGMNDLPDGSVLMGLNNPEVLCWCSSEDEELPTMTVTLTATPFPQTIISPNYDMSDSTILGVECAYVTASSDVVFAISVDDGVTWYMWAGEAWGTLTDTATGMTAETINAITTEQWAELMTTGQFKVRMTLFDENSSFTSFVMDYIN